MRNSAQSGFRRLGRLAAWVMALSFLVSTPPLEGGVSRGRVLYLFPSIDGDAIANANARAFTDKMMNEVHDAGKLATKPIDKAPECPRDVSCEIVRIHAENKPECSTCAQRIIVDLEFISLGKAPAHQPLPIAGKPCKVETGVPAYICLELGLEAMEQAVLDHNQTFHGANR